MEPRILTNDFLIDASFFFKQSKDAIFIIDQDKLIDTNRAGVKLLGLKDRDDVFDQDLFQLIKDQKGNDYTLQGFITHLNNFPHQNKVFQFVTRVIRSCCFPFGVISPTPSKWNLPLKVTKKSSMRR